PEHSALAGNCQLPDFGGCQPVDLKHTNCTVRETQQPADQIFLGRVDRATRFGIHVHDVAAGEIPHHIKIVGTEVDDHADVSDALRERAQAARVQLKDS